MSLIFQYFFAVYAKDPRVPRAKIEPRIYLLLVKIHLDVASATENVQRRIEITIMISTAIPAPPFSYSKVCDTFRSPPWREGLEWVFAIRADFDADAAYRHPDRRLSHLEHDVKTAMPAAVEAQNILLPVVAVIPHEVDCPRLLVQQAGQGLHAVTVDQCHCGLTCKPNLVPYSSRECDGFAVGSFHSSRRTRSPGAKPDEE